MNDYLLLDQLAAKCELSEEEVRAFEERGVIHRITKNGHGYYSARDCYRLRGMLHLVRDKGLPLAEAKAVVDGVRRASLAVGR